MALRLSGEEFSVVQGLDGQGWVREVDGSGDASPGLKITPGTGSALSVEKNDAIALRQLKAGGGYLDLWKLNASDRIQAGADLDLNSFELRNAILGTNLNVNTKQLSKILKLQGPDTATQQDVEIETWDAGYYGGKIKLENAYGPGDRGRIHLYTSDSALTGTVERMVFSSKGAQGTRQIDVYENLEMQTVGGKYQSVALPIKAGVPADADFNRVVDGLIALDSTNNRVYFRVGSAWKYAALT